VVFDDPRTLTDVGVGRVPKDEGGAELPDQGVLRCP
jgi:hypothetical protein